MAGPVQPLGVRNTIIGHAARCNDAPSHRDSNWRSRISMIARSSAAAIC
ncbi:Uncharacterised protein [Mycobacteroides abscessus subsp. abscessus]|nr:Uncharacterised protein [Mycobacteroides abscessus subsp. abscessus]